MFVEWKNEIHDVGNFSFETQAYKWAVEKVSWVRKEKLPNEKWFFTRVG